MEQIITTTTTITERCTLHKLSCPSWPTLPMVHNIAVVVGYCTVVVLGVSQINHWELYLLILHERPVALSPPRTPSHDEENTQSQSEDAALWLAHLPYCTPIDQIVLGILTFCDCGPCRSYSGFLHQSGDGYHCYVQSWWCSFGWLGLCSWWCSLLRWWRWSCWSWWV